MRRPVVAHRHHASCRACPSRPGRRPILSMSMLNIVEKSAHPPRRRRIDAGATSRGPLPARLSCGGSTATRRRSRINLWAAVRPSGTAGPGRGFVATIRVLTGGRGPALASRGYYRRVFRRERPPASHGRRDRRRPGGPARVPPDVVPRDGTDGDDALADDLLSAPATRDPDQFADLIGRVRSEHVYAEREADPRP